MSRFAHAVDKSTGKTVAEFYGPPNAREGGDSLSEAIYALSEILIRGKFPEKRGGLFAGDFGYAVDYENETFLLHPDYQDAECSCGCDKEYGNADLESHEANCANSIIRAKLDAWPATPLLDLMVRWDLEKRLTDRVAASLNSKGRYGCTCGREAIRMAWLADHGHDPTCMLTLPNFRYKATHFEVNWYKYIGRDMRPSSQLSGEEFHAIFKACWESIPDEIRKQARKDASNEVRTQAKITPERKQARNKSVAAALDHLSAGYQSLVLLGYSGGGTLAMLIAERLPKTAAVITIAANIDTMRWAALHNQPPLTGSLNPASRMPLPPHIRQIHFSGGDDDNVPPALIRDALAHQVGATFSVFEKMGHRCCWQEAWPAILKTLSEINVLLVQ